MSHLAPSSVAVELSSSDNNRGAEFYLHRECMTYVHNLLLYHKHGNLEAVVAPDFELEVTSERTRREDGHRKRAIHISSGVEFLHNMVHPHEFECFSYCQRLDRPETG